MLFSYVIDDREHVISKLVDHFTVDVYKKRLSVGDFALYSGDTLFAVFERKTIEDLASSIKDGRYHNKEKMIECREKTDCKLFFIIEGDWSFQTSNESVNGIKHSTLESAIFHMQVRDNIHMIFTRDIIDTINALNSFAKSMVNLAKKRAETPVKIGSSTPQNDDLVYCKMWQVFPGIGPIKSQTYAEKFTIADIYTQDSLKQLTNYLEDPIIFKSLLKAIPSCGAKTLDKIMKTKITLKDLINMNPTEICKCFNLPLGVSNNIYKFLH